MEQRQCPVCTGLLAEDNKTGVCTRTPACRKEYQRRYMADCAEIRQAMWDASRETVSAGTIQVIRRTHEGNPEDHLTRVVTDFCETFTVDHDNPNGNWEARKLLWRKAAHVFHFMKSFAASDAAVNAEREAMETISLAAFEAGLSAAEIGQTIMSARRKVDA